MRTVHLPLVAAIAALPFGGCFVYADPAPAVAVDYEPMYYRGSVVYYDSVGLPFIYVGRHVHYVPNSAPRYRVLVRHYHSHERAYRTWHRHHRHRHRPLAAPAQREPRGARGSAEHVSR